jgi:carbon-monoxide dehydrogenase small subunit
VNGVSDDLAASTSGSPTAGYALRVNGVEHRIVEGWIGESLLYVLRERLELPGSKNACEEGECGSCTVLLDDRLVCSCLVLAATAEGREVTTVEGLTPTDDTGSTDPASGALSDVQRAFVDAGAVQCGFCTPGLVMAVEHLLDHTPEPSFLEVREAISGNLCRCTGYGRIFDAVAVAVSRRGAGASGVDDPEGAA